MQNTLGRPHPTAADFGFPSPAADDINLTTPTLSQDSSAATVSSPQWPTHALVESSSLLGPEPDVVEHEDVVTPGMELQASLSFDAIVGADVDPAPSDVMSSSSLKAGPELRLPSFASLGIAAPHSVSIPQRHPAQDLVSAGDALHSPSRSSPLDTIARPVDAFGDDLCQRLGHLERADSPSGHPTVPSSTPSPLHHYVATLTPPDDNGRITWSSITKVATGLLNSPTATTPTDMGTVLSDAGDASSIEPPAAAVAAMDIAAIAGAAAVSTTGPDEGESTTDTNSDSSLSETPAWLKPIIQAMRESLDVSSFVQY